MGAGVRGQGVAPVTGPLALAAYLDAVDQWVSVAAQVEHLRIMGHPVPRGLAHHLSNATARLDAARAALCGVPA